VDWATHIRRILDRLGEDVTWTHSGSPATVRGIYLEPYREITLGEVGVGGSMPRFVVMTADVPALAVGDTIARGATTWRVSVPEPDALGGFTVLQLEKI
jgi:hypothetical protein